MNIDRRKALALLSFGAAAPAVAQAQNAGSVRFDHGVASGDPLQDRMILWTRITPEQAGGPVAYRWRLDPVDRRAGGAKSGQGVTGPERDYTVKVDVTGLDAGRAYTFQFESGGVKSPVGRTRTLPKGAVKDVVLAVASCTLYPNGYFNAYGAIAALPRVDAVLHLGDYIYEYGGPGSYGMTSAVAGERPHDPPHELLSLDDYRRRHAQYKADPQLQAAHARAPWIVVWDDHETANDSFKDGAQNHQPATEGDWDSRKARAIKAYYEWMPIREPKGGGYAVYRSFDFGDLASLFMFETRLTARDKQLVYDRDLPNFEDPAALTAFRAKLADPARRMMAPAQEAWLAEGMAASVKSGRTWQVLGNEVVMARVANPPIRKLMGEAAYRAATADISPGRKGTIERMDKAAAHGLPWGLDMWDGYPADRQRLYGIFRQAKANAIVVSGDSHAFWANELWDSETGGHRVAVEFGTTGITSPGAEDDVPSVPWGRLFAEANREVVFNDQKAKGFVLLTLTKTQAKGELIAVSSITDKSYTATALKTFVVKPGKSGPSAVKEA
ncbi:alkaline phosphatase D family protein [Phenylobacterium soli]|uniref:Alkaline phosphatase n=1 Tax=Phenylobacterium soli TaxID=2170551 RepID=A0A328AE48_9CAUL|nr:alkaline phosphatase D family protein [Phenylobacterium soli]RAK53062.1 alkaline phosphatase [Phenylobacterium soli]